jgi:hypothetical protein
VYGENLAMFSGGSSSVAQAIDLWYAESRLYDYSRPESNQAATGHFTQLVWKSTREIGIGMQTVGIKTYVVMQFFPRGNVASQYAANVQAPAPLHCDDVEVTGGYSSYWAYRRRLGELGNNARSRDFVPAAGDL